MPVDTTPTSQDATIEAGERLPARFWWPRWLGIGTAVVLAVLLLLRWGWDWYATAKLDAAVAAIKAKGEPLYPEDFNPPTVADKDNAAVDYIAAAAALPPKGTNWKLSWDCPPQLPLTDEEKNMLQGVISAHQEVLTLLRQARNKTRTDWGRRYHSPAINTFMPSWQPLMQLARFGLSAALYQHESGHDTEAIETLLDVLALARATDGEPMLISHLVAISMYALATSGATGMALDLKVASSFDIAPVATNPAIIPASRQQVQKLIAVLLDESMVLLCRKVAIWSERTILFDSIICVLENRLTANGLSSGASGGTGYARFCERLYIFLFAPAVKLDLVQTLNYMSEMALAGAQTKWTKICQSYREPDWLNHPTMANFLSRMLMPSLDRAFVQDFRNLTSRRMAAIALAIRLYQVDHAGQRPATLEALVPIYLPIVPRDPFDPADGPIRYKPTTQPAVLYSVGEDGEDDGGIVPADEKTRNEGEWKWTPDVIVPLDRVPRPPAEPGDNPTTAPAEGETPTTTSAPASEPGKDQ